MDQPEYCLLTIDHWLTCMDKSQWASWVQAVFSVVAIVAAVVITSRQMRHDAKLHAAAETAERERVAMALARIAANASGLLSSIQRKLATREAIYDAAEAGGLPFDLPELDAIEAALSGIPLHSLPAELVSPAMGAAWTVRQFRSKVHMTLSAHRSMNAAAFDDFFATMNAMSASLMKEVHEIVQAAPSESVCA